MHRRPRRVVGLGGANFHFISEVDRGRIFGRIRRLARGGMWEIGAREAAAESSVSIGKKQNAKLEALTSDRRNHCEQAPSHRKEARAKQQARTCCEGPRGQPPCLPIEYHSTERAREGTRARPIH